MANIPNGNYPVTVTDPSNGSTNATASGTLRVTGSATAPTVQYQFGGQGQATTVSSFNLLTTNVSWTVTNSSNNFTYVFVNGTYNAPPPRATITGGKVNVPSTSRPGGAGDGEDNWAATGEGEEIPLSKAAKVGDYGKN